MWLFRRTVQHLPKPTGPYVPGCLDVMLDYDERGLLMRLFYPTDLQDNDYKNSYRWVSWLPNNSYVDGLAQVLMTFLVLVRIFLWWGSKSIPAVYGAKPKTDSKLKPIIFSHGLGGGRFLYSSICCELASRGYLVVMLEHRDHSACHTYYYKTKEDAQCDNQTPIAYWRIELGKHHFEKRYKQICQRAEECSRAFDFLFEINKGIVPHNILCDIPSRYKNEGNLEDFVQQLDMDNVSIAGHSFGAATALLTMSKRSEFKQGILLDPWMFPIKDENLEEKIKTPLLFINTQTFHIANNVKAMEKFLSGDNREMYTLLRTTHENQTDSVFIAGYWLNWFMKKLDPVVALKINNFLMLEFLDKYVGSPTSIDDCRHTLQEEKKNFEMGLTRPWA